MAIETGCGKYTLRWYPGDLLRYIRRIRLHSSSDFFPTTCTRMHIRLVHQTIMNHLAQQRIDQCHISSRANGEPEISRASKRRLAWINHDQTRPFIACPPDPLHHDGETLGN